MAHGNSSVFQRSKFYICVLLYTTISEILIFSIWLIGGFPIDKHIIWPLCSSLGNLIALLLLLALSRKYKNSERIKELSTFVSFLVILFAHFIAEFIFYFSILITVQGIMFALLASGIVYFEKFWDIKINNEMLLKQLINKRVFETACRLMDSCKFYVDKVIQLLVVMGLILGTMATLTWVTPGKSLLRPSMMIRGLSIEEFRVFVSIHEVLLFLTFFVGVFLWILRPLYSNMKEIRHVLLKYSQLSKA